MLNSDIIATPKKGKLPISEKALLIYENNEMFEWAQIFIFENRMIFSIDQE